MSQLEMTRRSERELREALDVLQAGDAAGFVAMVQTATPGTGTRLDVVQRLACVQANRIGLAVGFLAALLHQPELSGAPLASKLAFAAQLVADRAAAFERFCAEELGLAPDAVLGLANPGMVGMQRQLREAGLLPAAQPLGREAHYAWLMLHWNELRTALPEAAPNKPPAKPGETEEIQAWR